MSIFKRLSATLVSCIDQVVGFGHQRTMQADNICTRQQFIQGLAPGLRCTAGSLCQQYLHTKGTRQFFNTPGQGAVAHQPQHLAIKFQDRVAEG